MTNDSFVPLPGSERGPVPGLEATGPVDDSARIEVTLVTRRRAELPRELVLGPETLTPAQMSERHGTDPDDTELIREVLSQHGIEVTQTYTGSRCVKASGTLAALAETFGASLSMVRSDHPTAPGGRVEHRYREGGLRIPAELDGIERQQVCGACGFDPGLIRRIAPGRPTWAIHTEPSTGLTAIP